MKGLWQDPVHQQISSSLSGIDTGGWNGCHINECLWMKGLWQGAVHQQIRSSPEWNSNTIFSSPYITSREERGCTLVMSFLGPDFSSFVTETEIFSFVTKTEFFSFVTETDFYYFCHRNWLVICNGNGWNGWKWILSHYKHRVTRPLKKQSVLNNVNDTHCSTQRLKMPLKKQSLLRKF